MNYLTTIIAALIWAIPTWALAHYGYVPAALGLIAFAVIVGNINARHNATALAALIARVLARQR